MYYNIINTLNVMCNQSILRDVGQTTLRQMLDKEAGCGEKGKQIEAGTWHRRDYHTGPGRMNIMRPGGTTSLKKRIILSQASTAMSFTLSCVRILPSNSERMHKATDGYSELRLMPGAGHADSVLTDAEQYGEWVKAFLDKVEGDQVTE